MDLFERRYIRLKSGEISNFKIECEALGKRDWTTIAEIIRSRVPTFGAAIGVPRGGMALQKALTPYATRYEGDTLLIVDDVYTTGASMRATKEEHEPNWRGPILGVALFARNPITDDWVKAVFTLTLDLSFDPG